MPIAELILGLTLVYLASGLLFAVGFVTLGVGKIDPAARGVSVGFRLLIFPGAMALWPFLAVKWFRSSPGGGHT